MVWIVKALRIQEMALTMMMTSSILVVVAVLMENTIAAVLMILPNAKEVGDPWVTPRLEVANPVAV